MRITTSNNNPNHFSIFLYLSSLHFTCKNQLFFLPSSFKTSLFTISNESSIILQNKLPEYFKKNNPKSYEELKYKNKIWICYKEGEEPPIKTNLLINININKNYLNNIYNKEEQENNNIDVVKEEKKYHIEEEEEEKEKEQEKRYENKKEMNKYSIEPTIVETIPTTSSSFLNDYPLLPFSSDSLFFLSDSSLPSSSSKIIPNIEFHISPDKKKGFIQQEINISKNKKKKKEEELENIFHFTDKAHEFKEKIKLIREVAEMFRKDIKDSIKKNKR